MTISLFYVKHFEFVFSGPKIRTRPESFLTRTEDRPEEIRSESDPTAFIFEPD